MDAYFNIFDRFDKDNNGKLNYHEWMRMRNESEREANKLFGKGPEWSHGDMKFFWTMSDAVSNGKWNHHRRTGRGNFTKRDARRLFRILRKIYKDVSEDSSDDEDERAVSDDAKSSTKSLEEELYLI